MELSRRGGESVAARAPRIILYIPESGPSVEGRKRSGYKSVMAEGGQEQVDL